MAIYYPSGCDDEIPAHVCDPCGEIEGGRVRSVAFIKTSFEFTDPTDPTEWQEGFASGDIILIPDTRGNYDGGAEVEGQGFGDQVTRLTGYNHQLQYQDPNYAPNWTFYDLVKRTRGYKVAFRTATKIHLVNATVQVIPKNPVQEDPNTDVLWDVLVKWASLSSPRPYDVPPGIFDSCVVLS